MSSVHFSLKRHDATAGDRARQFAHLCADKDWIDRGLDNLPRITLIVILAMAWLLTLAWPPPPPDAQPRVSAEAAAQGRYPLRLALPKATPIRVEDLAEFVRTHEIATEIGQGLATASVPAPDTPPQIAVAAAAAPIPAPVPVAIPDLEPGEFLAVKYDLNTLDTTRVGVGGSGAGNGSGNESGLVVSKTLLVDGVSAGSAEIRIEEGAQIHIATASVARALGDKAENLPKRVSNALASGKGFVPFYELRGAGIGVEYDPVTDRVSLSTPS